MMIRLRRPLCAVSDDARRHGRPFLRWWTDPRGGYRDRVSGLVCIAALGLDEEETSHGEQDQFPKADIFGRIEVAEWCVWMLPEGIDNRAGDLTDEQKPSE